jgi:hypothetical protein
MTKELIMTSSLGEQSFQLANAQRILVWQKYHPKIQDVWKIVGTDYIFEDSTDELIRNPDTRADKKTKARDGVRGK